MTSEDSSLSKTYKSALQTFGQYSEIISASLNFVSSNTEVKFEVKCVNFLKYGFSRFLMYQLFNKMSLKAFECHPHNIF